MNEEEKAKKEKYIRDLERLRAIRASAAKSEQENDAKHNVDNDNKSSDYSREINHISFDNDIVKKRGIKETSNKSNEFHKDMDIIGGGDEIFDEDDIDERALKKSIKKAEKKNKKKKHIVAKILLLLIIILVGYISYNWFFRQSGIYTIAIYGVDSRDGNLGAGALSDVNQIWTIDRATGEIRIVSVYRDTYLEIDSDGTYHKINEAYFKGGSSQAVKALERNLDVQIEDYAVFNWKAVIDAINILGGVDIEITDAEFKYINSFITETVNSTGIGSVQLKSAGMNHLDGVQAVAYARLRLMDNDYNRTERQRKVIGLAAQKAKEADAATLTKLVTTVLPETKTSISINDIMPFVRKVKKLNIVETTGFPIDKETANVGKMNCVIPVTLASNVVKLHNFLYPNKEYNTVNATVQKISDTIQAKISGKNYDSNTETKSKDSKSETIKESTTKESTTQVESMTESSEDTIVEATKSLEESTEAQSSEIGPGSEIPNAHTETSARDEIKATEKVDESSHAATKSSNDDENIGPGI